MTAPSNANTSGLVNVGHIVWWKAGGVSYYPEGEPFGVSKSCRVEPLVTAASAQARIAELEAEIAKMIAERSRRSVAWQRSEARADRLAKALMTARDYVSDAAEGHAWTASQVAELMRGNRPDNRQASEDLAAIEAALQQETQP